MIGLAFAILAAAALFGTALAILYARGPGAKPLPWAVPAVHGLIGASGIALLVAALRHGLGDAATGMGVGGFGMVAAALFALALLFGLWIALARARGKRPGGALVGVHATVAVAGLTLLLTVIAVI